MPLIHVTGRNGTMVDIDVDVGTPIMNGLRDTGLGILALCGGVASCATCQVYVELSWLAKLPPMEADEEDLLSESDLRRSTSRLSCQILMAAEYDGISIEIAPME